MNTKTSRNIATGAAASLAAIVVLMMVPTADTAPQGPAIYGIAEVVQMGPDGEVKSSQSVHNRIVDEGEELMLDALFDTGDAFPGKFGVICLSDDTLVTTIDADGTGELITSSTHFLDPDNTDFGGSSNACRAVDTVTKHGNGSATLIAEYEAGNHIEISAGFNSIWVCQGSTAGNDALCADVGDGLLAVVALPALQPVASEDTIRVSYTLDLSSDGS